MQKQNLSDDSIIRIGKDTHNDEHALGKSNLELLDEIDAMLDAPGAEHNLDIDKLKAHLITLQEKAPVMEDYVPGELLDNLKKQHPEFFSNTSEKEPELF